MILFLLVLITIFLLLAIIMLLVWKMHLLQACMLQIKYLKKLLIKLLCVAAEFPKTPSPKPARIPPQTPPAGGKSVEAGRIHSPRQIVSPCRVRFNHLDFARNSFELCPTNT